MARLLAPTDYGQVGYLISIGLFFSAICVVGLPTTVATFYPKERKDELLGESILTASITSLSVATITILLGGPLVALLIVTFALFKITVWIKLGERKYKTYSGFKLAAKLAPIPLSVILYLTLGIWGILVGYALPSLVIGFWGFGYLNLSNPSFSEVKKKAGFASRALGVDLSHISTQYLDKILIGTFFGKGMLGLYYIGFQMFTASGGLLQKILGTYLLPEKSVGVETKKLEIIAIGAATLLTLLVIILTPFLIPKVLPSFVDSIRIIQDRKSVV